MSRRDISGVVEENHILDQAWWSPWLRVGSQAPVEAPGEEGNRGGGESCSGCPLSPAVISLPSTYQELGCGLWGNFDKNQKNEFMLLSDALTQNLNNFSNSRKVKMKQGLSCFSRSESWDSEQEGPGLRATPIIAQYLSTPAQPHILSRGGNRRVNTRHACLILLILWEHLPSGSRSVPCPPLILPLSSS